MEALAVSAILEHRCLIAADNAVHEEWTHAASDPAVSGAVSKHWLRSGHLRLLMRRLPWRAACLSLR
ncbi:transcriptional repressor TraM [Rhizobium leguminosarum]|uniref:transcriptional repressor TraM n=1 Tax=Rhizobium leguminosarum TaxID=384 RepID=UPI003B587407